MLKDSNYELYRLEIELPMMLLFIAIYAGIYLMVLLSKVVEDSLLE